MLPWLGDVSTVVEDRSLIGDALVGEAGDQAQMQIVVEKLPGANTTEVTSGVEAALDELRPGLSGLQMSSATFRPGTYVHKSVDNLRIRLIVGAVLMLLVLALLFFDWRPTLIATVGIVSVGVGALVLHLFGTTFNTVVVAGLVVARAAVHDALSSVDAVGRRRRGEADEDGRACVVTEAASETGRAVLWATVVFALALLPIFLMDGLSGDSFFPPMAGACLVALVASLVVATTVTPALSMFLLSRARRARRAAGGSMAAERPRAGLRAIRSQRPAGSRHRRTRGDVGPGHRADRQGAAAPARGHERPDPVGGPLRHVAARDGPDHGASGERAANGGGGGGGHPRRAGRRRPGRRQRLRRDVGHRRVVRPRQDVGCHPPGRRRLHGPRARGDDILREADDRGAWPGQRRDHRAHLRQ